MSHKDSCDDDKLLPEPLKYILDYTYQNIQFADQKALFLAPINIAAIAAASWLYHSYVSYFDLFRAAVIALAIGIFFCGVVIYPRSEIPRKALFYGASYKDRDIFDPNGIAQYCDAKCYQFFYDRVDQTKFKKNFFEFVFKHSKIHITKYKYLIVALWFSLFGWLLLAAFAYFVVPPTGAPKSGVVVTVKSTDVSNEDASDNDDPVSPTVLDLRN